MMTEIGRALGGWAESFIQDGSECGAEHECSNAHQDSLHSGLVAVGQYEQGLRRDRLCLLCSARLLRIRAGPSAGPCGG